MSRPDIDRHRDIEQNSYISINFSLESCQHQRLESCFSILHGNFLFVVVSLLALFSAKKSFDVK